jgi:hypothetical protein
MAITIDQLKALAFGYLTGEDLLQWCPGQLLIKQNEVDSNSLQNGCNQAYAFVISQLVNRYDINTEITTKTGAERSTLCAQLTAIIAVSNCLGNAQGISEKMHNDIKWANKQLLELRNGQGNLPLPAPPCLGTDSNGFPLPYPASDNQLICSSFRQLG